MSTDTDTTVIARTVVRVVVPVILLTAVALLLQGHNLPGGGFIAGVLTVTAFALVYIVFGREFLQRELLHVDDDGFLGGSIGEYGRTFTFGLALAASSGLAAIVVGELFAGGRYEFITQGVWFVYHVPVYHEIEIPTALFFDLGVYFVVVGALLTILAVVGRE
ncbi:MnhB domain-containing protein [Halomarina oriensis]|uniref:Sodium:proton antiporter n=1 Tax=Halomarina oriensis TaxID=671145 RepID=A0A6B0GFP4_9EURY|nr:MnhB domain-containing protein [Halomarina oriensis]MWG33330.1 sodium:proton antiporter [Halomarina oriensis]